MNNVAEFWNDMWEVGIINAAEIQKAGRELKMTKNERIRARERRERKEGYKREFLTTWANWGLRCALENAKANIEFEHTMKDIDRRKKELEDIEAERNGYSEPEDETGTDDEELPETADGDTDMPEDDTSEDKTSEEMPEEVSETDNEDTENAQVAGDEDT